MKTLAGDCLDPHLRREAMTSAFQQRHECPPTIGVRAPGRVDLMGSHTDYNEGCVLTLPIDRETWILAAPRDDREHPKARTLGLRTKDGGVARAYPMRLFESGDAAITDRFAGHDVRITFSRERNAFVVDAPESIDVVETYWFAWMAFHPGSSVFEAPTD